MIVLYFKRTNNGISIWLWLYMIIIWSYSIWLQSIWLQYDHFMRKHSMLVSIIKLDVFQKFQKIPTKPYSRKCRSDDMMLKWNDCRLQIQGSPSCCVLLRSKYILLCGALGMIRSASGMTPSASSVICSISGSNPSFRYSRSGGQSSPVPKL